MTEELALDPNTINWLAVIKLIGWALLIGLFTFGITWAGGADLMDSLKLAVGVTCGHAIGHIRTKPALTRG